MGQRTINSVAKLSSLALGFVRLMRLRWYLLAQSVLLPDVNDFYWQGYWIQSEMFTLKGETSVKYEAGEAYHG